MQGEERGHGCTKTLLTLFWQMLNDIVQHKGFPQSDLFGFMVDEVGANWQAIITVYNGGPDNMINGRGHSYLFHWEQSLHIHTVENVIKNSKMNTKEYVDHGGVP